MGFEQYRTAYSARRDSCLKYSYLVYCKSALPKQVVWYATIGSRTCNIRQHTAQQYSSIIAVKTLTAINAWYIRIQDRKNPGENVQGNRRAVYERVHGLSFVAWFVVGSLVVRSLHRSDR